MMLCWSLSTQPNSYFTSLLFWRKMTLWWLRFCRPQWKHPYSDVIMTTMASQINSLTVVYSTVYSDADQRKHQSSASLAFVWGIHRGRWIPAQRASYAENVPFDDVIRVSLPQFELQRRLAVIPNCRCNHILIWHIRARVNTSRTHKWQCHSGPGRFITSGGFLGYHRLPWRHRLSQRCTVTMATSYVKQLFHADLKKNKNIYSNPCGWGPSGHTTQKWRRFDVIITSLLRRVPVGVSLVNLACRLPATRWLQILCLSTEPRKREGLNSILFSITLKKRGQNRGPAHWGRVTRICVGNITIIGPDNGLSPGRRQAIIWTNAGILLIGPLGTNFSENLIEILTFSFTKMRLKVSSAKWRPFCLGLC